jgi:hypothetical protein
MPGFMPDIHGFFAGEAFFPFFCCGILNGHSGRRASAGPGIQMQARHLFLDSGFAAFGRAPE